MDALIHELNDTIEAQKDEICQCFYKLLPAINDDYAHLIREVDLKERSRSEVAQEMNINVGNLNVKLHRARLSLRNKMELTCKVCATHGCLNCTCSN